MARVKFNLIHLFKQKKKKMHTFSFSKVSQARLDTCHQDLRVLFSYVIKHYDCTIVCGIRNKQDQNEAFENGKSQVKFPFSKHNIEPLSEAVDAAPYEKGGIDWSKDQMYYFSGYVLATARMLYDYGAISHKVRLGADWDGDNDVQDQRFNDLPHFELIM